MEKKSHIDSDDDNIHPINSNICTNTSILNETQTSKVSICHISKQCPTDEPIFCEFCKINSFEK